MLDVPVFTLDRSISLKTSLENQFEANSHCSSRKLIFQRRPEKSGNVKRKKLEHRVRELFFASKSVSDTADGFYEIEMGTKFLSQGGNMNIDISIDNKRIIALQIIEELVSCKNFSTIANQSS